MRRHSVIICSILVLCSAVRADGVPPSMEPADLVRQQVNARAEAMKQRIQADYDKEDWHSLLRKKETVDCFLLPLVLFHELADTQTFDWCRLLRHDYQPTDSLTTVFSSKEASEQLHDALAPFALTHDRRVRFRIQMRRFAYASAAYPLELFIEGTVGKSGTVAQCVWYEPCFLNRNYDFPMFPQDLDLRWNDAGMSLSRSGTGEQLASDSFHERTLLFNNPPFLYTLFDGLRCQRALTTGRLRQETDGGESRVLSSGSVVFSLESSNGDPIRTTTVLLNEAQLRAIKIRQEPLQLLHHAPTCYQIRREFDGTVVQKEDFQPSSFLSYLADGRVITVTFAKGEEMGAAVVPETMTVKADDSLLFRARFIDVSYELDGAIDRKEPPDSQHLEALQRLRRVYEAIDNRLVRWQPEYYSADDTSPRTAKSVLRLRLKYNAYAAVNSRDYEALADVLSRYEQLLRRDNVDHDMHVYSLEGLTQMAFEFVDDEAGWILADRFLRDAYARSDSRCLVRHVVRLVDQYRFGYALVALEALSSKEQMSDLGKWSVAAWQRLRYALLTSSGSVGGEEQPYFDNEQKAHKVLVQRLLNMRQQ